jgi:membrane peptidoglycan carboxypeptidase
VRLRAALANSLNAATIGLAGELTVPAILGTAQRLGVDLGEDTDRFGLSVALGAAEVRLLDLTAAYGTFANGGTHASPQAIFSVTPFGGAEPSTFEPELREDAVSQATAFMLSSILSDAEARRPAFGEAPTLRTSSTSAVKTGTSNDFRDNLTIGYTPRVVVGVWAGNKDGRPMRDASGITGAAPIWHDTMELLLTEDRFASTLEGPSEFVMPDTVVQTGVCDLGTLGVDGACVEVNEYVAAAPQDNPIEAFARLRLRRESGALCSENVAQGESGGEAFLRTPGDASVAAQVRSWASARGIQVAPPACPERTAYHASQGAPRP